MRLTLRAGCAQDKLGQKAVQGLELRCSDDISFAVSGSPGSLVPSLNMP